jgi:hypothetical protein
VSIQARVLSALREMIDAQEPFTPVQMGALPAEDGLSMAVSGGRAQAITLSGGATVTLDVALSCKHTDQTVALDTLCMLCETLTKAAPLPSGDGWQMTAVRLNAAPAYSDRDGTRWLYGGALTVEYAAD